MIRTKEVWYDRGFADGINTAYRVNRALANTLRWCWWVVLVECVLIAGAVGFIAILLLGGDK